MLELTDGMGASLFLEATGLPTVVYPEIEKVIWEGRTLNSTVVVVARADAKVAEADLAMDETNLAKACICAPIGGVVLSRNIDVGQIVAQSRQYF